VIVLRGGAWVVLKEWDIGCVEGRGDYKVCALEIWVQEGGDKGCVQRSCAQGSG
jgi:hypothetical protein